MSEASNITEKIRQGLNDFTIKIYEYIAETAKLAINRFNQQKKPSLVKTDLEEEITVEKKTDFEEEITVEKKTDFEEESHKNRFLFKAKGNLENGDLIVEIDRMSQSQRQMIEELISSEKEQTILGTENLIVKINGKVVIETNEVGKVIKNDLTAKNILSRTFERLNKSIARKNELQKAKINKIANFFKTTPENIQKAESRQISEVQKEKSRELVSSLMNVNKDGNESYEVINNTIILPDNLVSSKKELISRGDLVSDIDEILNNKEPSFTLNKNEILESNNDEKQNNFSHDQKSVNRIKRIVKDTKSITLENSNQFPRIWRVEKDRIHEILKNKNFQEIDSILNDESIKDVWVVRSLREEYSDRREKVESRISSVESVESHINEGMEL